MENQSLKKTILAHSTRIFLFGIILVAFRIVVLVLFFSPIFAILPDFFMGFFCFLTWIFARIALSNTTLVTASRYSLFCTANLLIWFLGGAISLLSQVLTYLPLIPRSYFLTIVLLIWTIIFVLGLIKLRKYQKFSKVFLKTFTNPSPNEDFLRPNGYGQQNFAYIPSGAPIYYGQPYQNAPSNFGPYNISPNTQQFNFISPPPLPSESNSLANNQ